MRIRHRQERMNFFKSTAAPRLKELARMVIFNMESLGVLRWGATKEILRRQSRDGMGNTKYCSISEADFWYEEGW